MEISITSYASGLTQYVTENNGIVSQASDGTLHFQRDHWDDISEFPIEDLAKWAEGNTVVSYISLNSEYRPIFQIGTRPEWDHS